MNQPLTFRSLVKVTNFEMQTFTREQSFRKLSLLEKCGLLVVKLFAFPIWLVCETMYLLGK